MKIQAKQVIKEGKTKIIRASEKTGHQVIITLKDEITAFDGRKRDILPQKGKWNTDILENAFRLLNHHLIPTHFIRRISDNSFLAWQCNMIPLEVVIRRVAFGSYLKRHPQIEKGTFLDPPEVEFFLKDDKLSDPLAVFILPKEKWFLYAPDKPLSSETLIGELEEIRANGSGRKISLNALIQIKGLALIAFRIIEKAWRKLNILLVDLKLEFGFSPSSKIVIADEINNDTWRLWPEGRKDKMLDKQLYREEFPLEEVAAAYQKVSKLSKGLFFVDTDEDDYLD